MTFRIRRATPADCAHIAAQCRDFHAAHHSAMHHPTVTEAQLLHELFDTDNHHICAYVADYDHSDSTANAGAHAGNINCNNANDSVVRRGTGKADMHSKAAAGTFPTETDNHGPSASESVTTFSIPNEQHTTGVEDCNASISTSGPYLQCATESVSINAISTAGDVIETANRNPSEPVPAGHLICAHHRTAGGVRGVEYASLFVVAEFRGRGVATALMVTATRVAHASGAVAGVLHAQVLGERGLTRDAMYRHYGFQNLTADNERQQRIYEVYPDRLASILNQADDFKATLGDCVHVTDEIGVANDSDPEEAEFFGGTMVIKNVNDGVNIALLSYYLTFCPYDQRITTITQVKTTAKDNTDVPQHHSFPMAEPLVFVALLVATAHLIRRYGAKVSVTADLRGGLESSVDEALTRLHFQNASQTEGWNTFDLRPDLFADLAVKNLRAHFTLEC